MRKSLFLAAMIAVAVGLLIGSRLSAQKPVPPRRGPALVDMSTIAQNSVRLKQSMEALKTEYKAKTEDLKKEGMRGNQLTEDARKLPAGSPERKELEQKVLKLRADYELHGKKVNDETREKETAMVYGMLRDFQDELGRFAQANNQQLILRYDPTPPDLTNARAILAEIQKPIVYQRGQEVTPILLEALNRRAPGAAASTGRAPASPLRTPPR